MTLFRDKDGNVSSKRVAGFSGLAIALGLTVAAMFKQDPASTVQLVTTWLGFVAIALGITVAERKS